MQIVLNLMIKTKHPVIGLVTEWKDASGKIEHRSESSNLGGTMRLGGQKCMIKKSSLSHKLYKKITLQKDIAIDMRLIQSIKMN